MVDLTGKRIAFLVAQEGVEQVELTDPWQAVGQAGGQAVLIAPKAGPVQAFNHLDKADQFDVDETLDQADAARFDGLVLPGGVANPDQLRTHDSALRFVRDFFAQGKPVAAICHAPWTLVEANLVRDRTLTSWPSLRTDIINAGGTWVDQEVHVSDSERTPNALVTSRKPADLPVFCRAMCEVFEAGPKSHTIQLPEVTTHVR